MTRQPRNAGIQLHVGLPQSHWDYVKSQDIDSLSRGVPKLMHAAAQRLEKKNFFAAVSGNGPVELLPSPRDGWPPVVVLEQISQKDMVKKWLWFEGEHKQLVDYCGDATVSMVAYGLIDSLKRDLED